MSSKKSIFRMFPILLIVVFMLAQAGSTYAAPNSFIEPVKAAEAPSLLQFKSNSTFTGTLASPAICPTSIGFGETIQCSIASAGEVDTYSFTANAGDRVLVRMSKSSGSLWPRIKILSGATELCQAYSSVTAEIASCTLTSAGTYTILVNDGFNETYTGDYYLYLQRLNNPGSPLPITFGQTLSGSIITPAEMDSYTFTASAGDKVLVRMSKSSGSLWPGIRVYSPDGIKLCDASSSVTSEIASCILTGAGTYTILVNDGFNGTYTGDYYLYLQRLNNPGSPLPITFGQTLSGSIITPAEMDSYTFTASAGDKVLVRMSKSSGSLWPGIRVYSPDGIKLCDASSSVTSEIATCTLTGAGIYTILANDGFNGTYTGNYYLYLQRLNNPGSPLPITFGQTLSGSIITPAEMDSYTFTASAGDKVLVRMSNSLGSLWPGIRVYSPDGIKLCEAYSSVTAETASCTLTSAGIYTILVNDGFNGTYTGDYYLYLQRLNNPGSPLPITFGQTLSGSIITPAEMDSYTFTASAGDKVLVRMSKSSGSLWPGIRVYSPDGIKLCDASSSVTTEIASCTLASAGTYTILVNDGFNGTYTGDYYLYLQRLNNPGSPLPITFGQTLSGSIITPAEMGSYTFTASAGDKVLVRMSKSSGSLWPGIRVYSPDGTQLCDASSSVTSEIASCTLTGAGTYTIQVNDGFNGTYTGDYYLYLQRLNNPGSPMPITFDQTLPGSIITPAEMDSYTFTASAGDKVLVRMSKSSGSLWPGIRVYSPGGIKLCEAYSSVIGEIASCTLTSTGTYTILANDGLNGTYTGDYYLYLQWLSNSTSPVSISGNAGVAGVTLSYIDGTPKTATADGSGNYSFTVPFNWSGTVTPSLVGYVFTPASRSYTDVTDNQTGQDYTANINTFADVPPDYWAYSFIERLYRAGITGGCATTPSLMYCPDATVTRAQMAVFLLKGIHGSSYTPPAVGADTGFTDVATDYWAAAWIKQLATEGITGGCGTGIYCPDAAVTRAQMAIFLLRAKHGSSYSPPAATGVFTDVPVGYWADKWIEQLAIEGITGGCATTPNLMYCPDADVTRAQMAVFLVRTFNLP